MSIYYSDDWVTLYNGDCLEVPSWLAADVLVTDPPYGMAYQSNSGQGGSVAIRGDQDTCIHEMPRWPCGVPTRLG
jgi:DNA modification methylase